MAQRQEPLAKSRKPQDAQGGLFDIAGCCCRCIDDDAGFQVTKLPEWNRPGEDEDDEEEEIHFSPIVRARAARGRSVEQWSSLGKLRPQDLDFSELTRESVGAVRSKPDRRGINFHQLKRILVFLKKRCDEDGAIRGWYDHRTGEQLYYRTLTLADLNHWVIQPVCSRHQCSYVEAIAQQDYAQLPAWFVGHSWDEPVVDFVKRAMKHGTLGAGDAFWCQAFALRGSAGDCQMLAGPEPSVEPLRLLRYLRVTVTSCTRATLDEVCQGLPGALSSLEIHVSDSPKLMEVGPVQGLGALQQLQVSFRCPGLQMADVFCRSLAGSLLDLDLSFVGCLEFRHLGGGSSSASSPGGCCLPGLRSLQSLKVDASGCTSLSSIDVLSEEMQALMTIQLRLADCFLLTSLEELTRPLGSLPHIKALELSLPGCCSLRSLGSLSSHLRELTALERLRLNLSACESLEAEACAGLQDFLAAVSEEVDLLVVGEPLEGGEQTGKAARLLL